MKASKNQKQAKHASHNKPRDREIRHKTEPGNFRKQKPAWNFRLIDHGCSWDFKQLSHEKLWDDIFAKLKDYETMTWQEILDASGGRKKGNNNHPVPIEKLIPPARKRLKELRLNDISHLFSLRLTSEIRIWGILDGFVLKLLWYDSGHQVCPILK